MPIQIIEYTQDKKTVWNNFVDNSNNGTIFHNLDFLSYHQQKKFNIRNLLFYRKKTLMAVMPMALFKDNADIVARSPFGGSFGGIVYANLDLEDSLEIVSALKEYLLRNRIVLLSWTSAPAFYNKDFNINLDFALFKSGFVLEKREIVNAIRLNRNDTGSLFNASARRSLKKSLRSAVAVSETDDVGSFYTILEKTIIEKHGAKITHSLPELVYLHRELKNKLKIFMAYYKDKPIAATLLFICNPRVIISFYICSLIEFQEFRPLNAIFSVVTQYAARNNFAYLDLGTSSLQMQPNFGLMRFKQSLGAENYFRDTCVLKLKA